MKHEPATGIYLVNLTTIQNNFQIQKQKVPIETNFFFSIFNTVR